MKFILQQFWSREYQPLADITYVNKQHYAHKHGYDCKYAIHSEPYSCWERPMFWEKVLHLANEGDYILFTGCDTLIMRDDCNLNFWVEASYSAELIVALDNEMVFSDAMLIKVCKNTIWLFNEVWHQRESYSNEQEAITDILTKGKGLANTGFEFTSSQYIREAELRLNSSCVNVSVQLCDFVADHERLHSPGVIPFNHAFNEDTFILHMGGKSLAYRLAMMPRFLPL